MNTIIARTNSSPTDAVGQFATVGRWLQVILFTLVFTLVGLGGSGCRNLYREAQTAYPADSCDRFRLRLDEAQQAEKRAEQAAATLDSQLASGLTGRAIEPDVDRLELTALDFNRRAAAARDAAAACEHNGSFTTEAARLVARALEMQEAARDARQMAAHP